MARSCVPGSDSPPRHTQSWPSLAASASRSIRTSHSGFSLRKLSSDVVRHSPRGCSASCQGLNSFLPRRLGNGMLSGRSKISLSASLSAAKRLSEEPLHRCGILRLDPGQCLRAFPLFKPEVGIIVRRFDSGSYIDDGHGKLLDWATTQAADSRERLGILILAILGSCFALSLSPYTRNFLLRIHLFSDRQNDVRRPNSLDHEFGASRWQYHRIYEFRVLNKREMAGTAKKSRPASRRWARRTTRKRLRMHHTTCDHLKSQPTHFLWSRFLLWFTMTLILSAL